MGDNEKSKGLQSNSVLETAALFMQLSDHAQATIIDLIKSLLSHE